MFWIYLSLSVVFFFLGKPSLVDDSAYLSMFFWCLGILFLLAPMKELYTAGPVKNERN